MKTTSQIAKEIDLQRIKSILEDEPIQVVKERYEFDLPIMEVEMKLIKTLLKCETK